MGKKLELGDSDTESRRLRENGKMGNGVTSLLNARILRELIQEVIYEE